MDENEYPNNPSEHADDDPTGERVEHDSLDDDTGEVMPEKDPTTDTMSDDDDETMSHDPDDVSTAADAGDMTAGDHQDRWASDATDPIGMQPPAPAQQVAHQSGLVRDPYATFGGVMSGIAHRYGWDVSLTRLGFLATVFLTAGSALLLYLLAWLIVPRATYWPPNGRVRPEGGLSNREIGFGLAGIGVLIFLAVGSGSFGSAIVPLALVGGGVWLLMQSPRETVAAGAVGAAGMPTSAAVGVAPPPAPPSFGGGPGAPPPAPTGSPVPQRKRRRRWVVGIFVALMVGFLAIAGLVIALIFAASEGEFDIDTDRRILSTPTEIEDFPIEINEDAAEVQIDLTGLSADDFENSVEPVELEVRVDVGSIRVVVPSDVSITADAGVNIGEVTLYGDTDAGFNAERTITNADPDVILDLDLDIGDIDVVQVSPTPIREGQ